MKGQIQLILFALAVVLAGCSAITRPPPAAAYMETYGKKEAVMDLSFSYYAGVDDDGSDYVSEDVDLKHSEWWGDLHLARYISGGYFTFGWGLQTYTPMLQFGFVSPYFGFTAWTNSIILEQPVKDDENEKWLSHYSGGAMAIEQVSLDGGWKLGMTQHLSKNGKERYESDNSCCAFNIDAPKPEFYMEIGGGFYAAKKPFALEFRYGRDLTNDDNRFAFTADLYFDSPVLPVGPNDVLRKKRGNGR